MLIEPKLSLTRSIVNDLGLAIVTGVYDDKGFPTEKELYEFYGVSRNIIREAVKMLTAKGLLSARPRLGTVIEPEDKWNLLDPDILKWLLERKFSFQRLIEFTQMRAAIEPKAAALATQTGTPAQKQKILSAFEQMVSAEQGVGDTLAADIAFHISILEASNNRLFKQMRELIDVALRTSIKKTNHLMGLEKSETLAHKKVCDAIMGDDAEFAHLMMTQLIDIAMVNILKGHTQEKALSK